MQGARYRSSFRYLIRVLAVAPQTDVVPIPHHHWIREERKKKERKKGGDEKQKKITGTAAENTD